MDWRTREPFWNTLGCRVMGFSLLRARHGVKPAVCAPGARLAPDATASAYRLRSMYQGGGAFKDDGKRAERQSPAQEVEPRRLRDAETGEHEEHEGENKQDQGNHRG